MDTLLPRRTLFVLFWTKALDHLDRFLYARALSKLSLRSITL